MSLSPVATCKRQPSLRRLPLEWIAGFAVAFSVTSPTSAQDRIRLDLFRPAEAATDGFALSRPTGVDFAELSAQLSIDYANDPKFYRTRGGGAGTAERVYPVRDQLTMQGNIAFGLSERLTLYAGLPYNLWMSGQRSGSVAGPDSSGVGDLNIGGRYHLFSDPSHILHVGAQITADLPSAQAFDESTTYIGENGALLSPEGLVELIIGSVHVTGNLGARLRELRAAQDTIRVGNEITYALGASVPIRGTQVNLHAEVFGSTEFDRFLISEVTPVEGLVGAKISTNRDNRWQFGAAAGSGLQPGYGAPDWRLLASIGWISPPPPEGSPTQDFDGDGIVDANDACPRLAEDDNGIADDDGCPDADGDLDGVPDATDACLGRAEDKDGFEDTDGCPDFDNDGDGIADRSDGAPNAAEDLDGFEDSDGKPDPDNDKDGVDDVNDKCPLQPGSLVEGGCPAAVRLDGNEIKIAHALQFEHDEATLLPESDATLEEVYLMMIAHPEILHVLIEGHTDSSGDAADNQELSEKRAASVKSWLVGRGVQEQRLEARGFGASLPVLKNGREDHHASRRVEFHITRRADKSGATPAARKPSRSHDAPTANGRPQAKQQAPSN